MFLLPLQMVGCSHETTETDAVGRLRLGAVAVDAALASLQADGVAAVLLSTCHRTELYWSGDVDLTAWFEVHVAARVDAPVNLEHREADLAVRHLFSVAAGMCSARYGEPEILRQVRTAWFSAQTRGATDALLDTVFRRAVEASRYIRQAIGTDADPSLGARVRDLVLAHGVATDARPMNVLIVGAGDAARGVLDALADDAARAGVRVSLTSRSDEPALRLAAAHDSDAISWAARDGAITAADVVVFAVQSSIPLIDGAAAERLLADRERDVLWIDLGVPPNVDARALPSCVHLVDLDALAPRSRRDAVRDRRAQTALQRELARFAADTQRRRIGARITALEERAATVARAAVTSSPSGVWTADAADAVARSVTRALLREISELSA